MTSRVRGLTKTVHDLNTMKLAFQETPNIDTLFFVPEGEGLHVVAIDEVLDMVHEYKQTALHELEFQYTHLVLSTTPKEDPEKLDSLRELTLARGICDEDAVKYAINRCPDLLLTGVVDKFSMDMVVKLLHDTKGVKGVVIDEFDEHLIQRYDVNVNKLIFNASPNLEILRLTGASAGVGDETVGLCELKKTNVTDIRFSYFTEEALQVIARFCPKLEKLTLGAQNEHRIYDLQCLAQFPKLKELALFGGKLNDLNNEDVPLDRITSLKTCFLNISFEMFSSTIPKMQNVEELGFSYALVDFEQGSVFDYSSLERLKVFYVPSVASSQDTKEVYHTLVWNKSGKLVADSKMCNDCVQEANENGHPANTMKLEEKTIAFIVDDSVMVYSLRHPDDC